MADMPVEQKLDLLIARFGTLEWKVDTLGAKVDAVDAKVDAVDAKVDAVDAKVGGLDAKVDTVLIRLDETRDIAKLGLEAVEGFRETTSNRFDELTRHNAEQMALLESVVVHVRKRVDRIEPAKARRRRS